MQRDVVRTQEVARIELPPPSSSSAIGRFAHRVHDAFLYIRPSIPEEDRRVYIMRLILLSIAGSIHVALIIWYASFGRWWAVGTNCGSVSWYVMTILVLRSGRQHTAMALGFLEAVVHGFAFTLLLGLQAGYVFYNFAFVTVAFLAYRGHEMRPRVVLATVSIIMTAVEILMMRNQTPMVVLDPLELEVLCYLNVIGSLAGATGSTIYFDVVVHRTEARLARALARSEALLLNILPAPIAERLKHEPGTIADNFPSVTVLFADIVGFTPLAAAMSGPDVVNVLNDIFSLFDHSADQHGVEKIKTIGDAYMVVGGLPPMGADHAGAVCDLALDMQAGLEAYSVATGLAINVRIGIHTGPVVAGVIGRKKFAYDIWGDTVNTASRMESHGIAGRIQVSDTTHRLLADRYHFEERGVITLKGRGEVRAWFLCGRPTAAETPAA
ncbi:response regulator [Limnoglobus roseus]|uniref:Adenylate cyclase n=1 Tax=Limnoglobus roseus TaxID=2598579 RepID=A0A5C1A9J4_9BACT|nr:response regulator [Limnoglobus roseus]